MNECVHVGAECVVYSFSAAHRPAAEIESVATIVLDTREAYDHRLRTDADLQGAAPEAAGNLRNPVTGPIFVRGAYPGDGLDVAIDSIELGSSGLVAITPGIGVLGDAGIVPHLGVFDVRPDGLWYQGRLRFPLRPNVGTIGVAPPTGSISTLELGSHGGNLDCNEITHGTTLHLPVHVPGALLAAGDVHARMGFGEVCPGVNVDATVALTVTRVPGAGWQRPWFETPSEVMTLGVARRLEDAIREATVAMADLLRRRLGISLTQAAVLTGAGCDIRLGQASKFGVNVSAYAAFPKESLLAPPDRRRG